MTETIIIIPCYNEAERLDVEAFTSFKASHKTISFLFVDDGSTDRTGSVIESMREACPDSIRLLKLERNSGKSEAVRLGVLKAFESDPQFVGYWDADLSTPLNQIPVFLDALRSDTKRIVVMGSRVRSLGRIVERRMMRHYLGRIFATCAAITLGVGVYDTQCGAKAFRVTDDLKDLFREPFIAKWVFDVELLARLIRTLGGPQSERIHHAILEQPLDEWKDIAGSKLRWRDAIRGFLDLVRIARRYPRRNNQG